MGIYTKKTWHDEGETGAVPVSASNLQYMDSGIECSLSKDVGMIAFYCGIVAPDGWLVCDGLAVSRTIYEPLFDVIGTNFGGGDGSTTFNLPDLRGMFIRGWNGNNSGIDSNRSFGSIQDGTTFTAYGSTVLMDAENADMGSTISRGALNASYVQSYDATEYRVRPDNIALLPCIYTGVFQNIQF